MAMDVQRDPAILRRKKRRRAIVLGVATLAVIAISVAVSKLKPAAPTVAAANLWIKEVRRGPMVREVRGTGTFVPEEIRWIPATTGGRVEKIVLQQGAEVKPGSVIIELSNPDLQQAARNAELDWKTAVAQLATQRVNLTSARQTQQNAVAEATSNYTIATNELEANRTLAAQGIVADFVIRQKEAGVQQAKGRLELAKSQLASSLDNEPSLLAPAEAAVNQRKADFDRLSRQLDDLHVKASITGQLQLVAVERGQQVGAGTNLARVSDPAQLKANIRISETQMRDVKVGQLADIDTHNGHVKGSVIRTDPAAQGGTVGVDIRLEGPLPPGSRPDVSVEGTIELERLQNVLFVESPAFGQENGTISLFKLGTDGEAVRTPVKLGRRSVQYVEIVDGLNVGDRVVLSDMSQYDSFDRVRLN